MLDLKCFLLPVNLTLQACKGLQTPEGLVPAVTAVALSVTGETKWMGSLVPRLVPTYDCCCWTQGVMCVLCTVRGRCRAWTESGSGFFFCLVFFWLLGGSIVFLLYFFLTCATMVFRCGYYNLFLDLLATSTRHNDEMARLNSSLVPVPISHRAKLVVWGVV